MNHSFSENVYGYESYSTKEELKEAYQNLDRKAQKLRDKGLCATVYTQLTDVEEEVNGLITYDRKVIKI